MQQNIVRMKLRVFLFLGDQMPGSAGAMSFRYGIFEKFQFREKDVPNYQLNVFVKEKNQSKVPFK